MRPYLAGLEIAVNAGGLALAALGGWDLARRGGFRPAEIGMALAALGQLATEPGPGWAWLLRTGAALIVIYTLWQMGRLVVSAREAGAERSLTPLPPSPCRRGGEAAQVRAVASWPGRRRG